MKGLLKTVMGGVVTAAVLLTLGCNEVKVEREVDRRGKPVDISRGLTDRRDLPEEVTPMSLTLEQAAELARTAYQNRTTKEGDLQVRTRVPTEEETRTAEETVQRFAPFILNPAIVGHYRLKLSQEMEDILVEFNWGLWTLIQSPDLLLNKNWIEWRDQYAVLVTEGCWQPELGRPSLQDCQNLPFFKKDYRSALIFYSWLRDRVEPSLAQKLPAQSASAIAACLNENDRNAPAREVDLGAWTQEYNQLRLRALSDSSCQVLLEDYYTYMKVLFGLRGSASPEAPLALANLRFGIAWASYLERNKFKSTELQEAHQAFATDFQSQLNSLSDRDRWKSEVDGWREYATLISNPEVFMCSRRSNTPFCREMLSKAAGFIYNQDFGRQDCGHPTLNCSFVEALEMRMNGASDEESLAIQGERPVESEIDLDAMNSVNSETERSLKDYFSKNYLQALDYLRQGERQRVYDNLGLRELNWRSEYFYLVDGLFHGHLWPKDAGQFWNELPLSQGTFKTMHDTIDAYIRLEVARLVVATNEYMTTFYRRRDEFTIQELVRKTVEESQDLTAKWFELHLRIAQVNTFVDQSMRQYQDFYSLNRMLNNLSKDVMYLSSFPNMMMLAFFMAEEDFKMEIRGFWGAFSITSKDIIKGLFWGSFRKPWFAFSYDNVGLDIYQIMFSFYYALRTEAFETFGRVMREEGGVQRYDTVQFFKTLVSQFLQDDIVGIRGNIRSVREILNGPTVREVDQICSDLSALDGSWDTSTPLAEREGYGTYPRDTAIISIEDVDKYLFGGEFSTVNTNTPSGFFASLYSGPFIGMARQLQRIRSVVKHNLTYVDSLLDMLKLHYAERGRLSTTTDAERQQMEREIRTIGSFIDQQKARVSEALTWAFHIEEKYGDCAYKITAVQKNRLKEIYKAELAHAEEVHELMTVLDRLVEIQGPAAAQATSVGEMLALQESLLDRQTGSVRERLKRALDRIQSFLVSGAIPDDTSVVTALSAMLRIPFAELTRLNLASIPSDKSNFCESIGSGEYCGFDRFQITEDGGVVWEYQKADFDFRVASYLKKGIAPFVKFTMPSKFEDVQAITRKKVHQVYYRDGLQALQEQVFLLHNDTGGRFSEWIKDFENPKILTDKLFYLTEMYQLGEVELFEVQCLTDYYKQRGELPALEVSEPAETSAETDAQASAESVEEDSSEGDEFDLDDPQASDVCRFQGKIRKNRVTAQRLADSVLNLIHLVGMDRDEATFIDRMGRDTFHSYKFYQSIFLDEQNDRLERTIFEKTFENLRGFTFHQSLAENYYRQFNTMGHILFAVPDQLACSIRENFKRSMETNYFQPVDEFVAEALRREETAKSGRPISVIYEVGRELGVRNSDGEIEYLSRRKLEDHRIATNHFHNEVTSGFYQKVNIETQDGRHLICETDGESR